jgi:methionyl-tRNA synthetase
MAHKYRQGEIKKVILKEPFELSLEEKAREVLPNIRKYMDQLKVADALEEVVKLARFANKYIDVSEPWALFKNEEKQEVLDHVLYHLLETIRFIAVTLQPFIPQTADKIARQIGVKDLSFDTLSSFGVYEEQTLGKAEVLFERYDLAKKLAEILEEEHD